MKLSHDFIKVSHVYCLYEAPLVIETVRICSLQINLIPHTSF